MVDEKLKNELDKNKKGNGKKQGKEGGRDHMGGKREEEGPFPHHLPISLHMSLPSIQPLSVLFFHLLNPKKKNSCCSLKLQMLGFPFTSPSSLWIHVIPVPIICASCVLLCAAIGKYSCVYHFTCNSNASCVQPHQRILH